MATQRDGICKDEGHIDNRGNYRRPLTIRLYISRSSSGVYRARPHKTAVIFRLCLRTAERREYWNHNVAPMNIIQVLRQYNPKSMERRGINLAASPFVARALRERLPPHRQSGYQSEDKLWVDDDAGWASVENATGGKSRLRFSSLLSRSDPFSREGKKMVMISMSRPSRKIFRIIWLMFDAENT